MEHRINLDNVIFHHISLKNAWSKLDSNKLSDSIINQISQKMNSLTIQSNLSSPIVIRKRIEKIRKNRKQLENIKKIPYVQQRSEEWYEIRNNLITASDFGDALGIEKFGKKNDGKSFYKKKCGYETVTYDTASIFLQWGVMFEPVATSLYETRTGIPVHEFGIIKHPRHKFLGASPDGINDLGVMLEIKCPYKRIITDDSVLKQYYYQMQGQLDACDLDECDFLEVKFEEYDCEETFWDDYETEFNIYTSNFMEKGIIHKMIDSSYIYSPPNLTKKELESWNRRQLSTNTPQKVVYWYVDLFSLKRVETNRSFINNMNIQLQDVWNKVLEYRKDPELYKKQIGRGPSSSLNNPNAVRKTISKKVMNTVGALFRKEYE